MKCTHLKNDKVQSDFEKEESGYSLDGCCGGQCKVIWGMMFCPFCGEKL